MAYTRAATSRLHGLGRVHGPCTQPCTRPCTGRVHGCVYGPCTGVHGPYTAVYGPCTRPCMRPCTRLTIRPVHDLVHGRVRAVYTYGCVHGPCPRPCTQPCTRLCTVRVPETTTRQLKPRLHDTACCHTGCTTDLTTVLNEQTVRSTGCQTGLNVCIHDTTNCGCQLSNRFDNRLYRVNGT